MEAPEIPGSPVNNKEIGDDTMFEEPISGFDFTQMLFIITFFNDIICLIIIFSLAASHQLVTRFRTL